MGPRCRGGREKIIPNAQRYIVVIIIVVVIIVIVVSFRRFPGANT